MIKKIVVLASGKGTNFAALRESLRRRKTSGEIIALVSDNPSCNALLLAHSFGIQAISIPFRKEDRAGFHSSLFQTLKKLQPDLIVAAGYMRILQPDVVDAFPQKIINIHPSLLPSFPGMDSIRKAWNYGVAVTGCTTHFVDNTVDGGVIIQQAVVKIQADMNLETLETAIHKAEHRLLPQTVRYFLEDKIKIQDRRVYIQK
jgi:phosphoribosylglycinamide formyltransferase 1